MANTNQLPTWANWIAMDEDEQCWCYQVEPNMFFKGWYENEVGLSERIDFDDCFKGKQWQDCVLKV